MRNELRFYVGIDCESYNKSPETLNNKAVTFIYLEAVPIMGFRLSVATLPLLSETTTTVDKTL